MDFKFLKIFKSKCRGDYGDPSTSTTVPASQSNPTTIWTGTIFELIKIVVFEGTNGF